MLIRSIERFLRRHAMSPSMFGRQAAQDPRLVRDLREGRAPRDPLDQRLRGFMDGFEFAQTYHHYGPRPGPLRPDAASPNTVSPTTVTTARQSQQETRHAR